MTRRSFLAAATTAPSLSVVIPMYEEAENVAPMLERVHAGLADYDGSWVSSSGR